jgi:hypothetical protein
MMVAWVYNMFVMKWAASTWYDSKDSDERNEEMALVFVDCTNFLPCSGVEYYLGILAIHMGLI